MGCSSVKKDDHTPGQESNPAFPTQLWEPSLCENPLWDFAINMVIQLPMTYDTERENHEKE